MTHYLVNFSKVYVFFSDDDDVDMTRSYTSSVAALDEAINTDVDISEPSPKRRKIEEDKLVVKPDKLVVIKSYKKKSIPEKCPRCEKQFKRLSLHRCKLEAPKSPKNKVPKLKPSDVPLPEKCTICKKYYSVDIGREKHMEEKHSQLICKTCKFVSKTAKEMKLHSRKCGIKIEAINKPVLRGSKNKK